MVDFFYPQIPNDLTDEEQLLLARTDEWITRAEGGAVSHSGAFLNPGEQYLCRTQLLHRGKKENRDFLFFGGYPFAERALCFCLPDYLADAYACDPDCDIRAALLGDCIAEDALGAVSVSGSGYKTLSHRDYLGSLLALGIERHTIGDIAVKDDCHAVIVARRNICTFLLTALERVGADKVHASPLSQEELSELPDTRKYEHISDTVASPRLDAIVAVCANLARDKAKQAVSSGLVELNFRPAVSPDTEVPEGAYLSIRGIGRFYFEGIDGTSKKGRLRIHVKRFI